MSVRVIEDGHRVENGKLVIVLEGDNPESVVSVEAKQLAVQKAASLGFPRIGINSQSGSFPVDSQGRSYEDWTDQSKRGLISAYRNEIVLMGGI